MPRVSAADPIRDFKFVVEIKPVGALQEQTEGIGRLGFAVVSGLSVQNEVIGYREGGMNTHQHKLVGQSDFSPVTFSRGVFFDQFQLYNWQKFMHTWSSGLPSGGTGGSTSGANEYRCTIGVKILDHPSSGSLYKADSSTSTQNLDLPASRLAFVLYNCWPGAFAMTDLNAGNSGILVQQMTIHHEGFQLVKPDEYSTAMGQ